MKLATRQQAALFSLGLRLHVTSRTACCTQVHLYVAGPGIDHAASQLRHAGGEQNWTVACKCGVTDDDGERMLCCDRCASWHHAHCQGIPDSAPDPSSFVCDACQKSRRR